MLDKSKVAFICPLYDMRNHFDLAFNLYKSKIDLGISEDLYFVFSNVEQKDKFRKRIYDAFKDEILYLILPEDQLHYKSVVVVKKLYALRELRNQYDYLSLVDSESLFYKNGDFPALFNEIWESGSCLNCNVSPQGFLILRYCFRALDKKVYYNKKLRKEFGNYKYNFWFNEIQVYKCDTLDGFFEWLDQFDPNGYLNEWNCFEYYLYAAYLILECDFHLKRFDNLVSNGGIMEHMVDFTEEEQYEILNVLGTHWSSNRKITNKNTYLLFHLDREEDGGIYMGGKQPKHFPKSMMWKCFVKDFLEDKLGYKF